MNILLSGNLSSLALPIAREFIRDKNKVVLASNNAEEFGVKLDNLITHSINPAATIFRDALSSYKFDAIIYLATREEQLSENTEAGEGFFPGQQLDGLLNCLELARNSNSDSRFFFVSSTEIYGNASVLNEDVLPEPATINGDALLVGEKYCKIYQKDHGMFITILRLTNVYGPEEKSGLLHRILDRKHQSDELNLPGSASTLLSFLHTSDVIDFIKRALDETYYPEALVVNLSSSKPVKLSNLAKALEKYYSTINFNDGQLAFTKPAIVGAARKLYDWFDVHNLMAEIGEYVELSSGLPNKPLSSYQKLVNRLSKYPNLLKWGELIFGAALAAYLSQITGTLIQFQYVDFRLVYVVIMGSIYGLQAGLIASVFMSLFVLFTWLNLGVDWKLLVYNVGNWFPFALYFATGLITGYNHDKTENTILYERKQNELILNKYSFLYEVFTEVRQLKDEFRERLIGYRDSFGKIFSITRELDELQEHAVYLRALSILEELMDNNSIAIYSIDSNRSYARLEASSSTMNKTLGKSIKISDFPDAMESIDEGRIFQNVKLLNGYPAYIAPVLANAYPFNVPVALIIIWNAGFNQFSLYYYNLFKVISGMIQASLVRAASFLDANYEKIYLPATRILTHEAFVDVLKVRFEMRKNKMSDFQAILLQESGFGSRELDQKISECIRSTDIVGLLNNKIYYILLSQASPRDVYEVIERLGRLDVPARYIDANEIPLDLDIIDFK